MQVIYGFLILVGFYPLFRVWKANRRTSLTHASAWSVAAWTAWGVALTAGTPDKPGFDPWRYVALTLTGAAGVAVLGARRPHVGAWNFVVLGLLAVMLLPLGENLFLGTPPRDGLRIVFLGATLAVGTLNYVPTASAVAALWFGCASTAECVALFADLEPGPMGFAAMHLSLLMLPWLGLLVRRRGRAEELAVTRLWLDFRDRFGLFWGQRVREQYNVSAANAGLPGTLRWHGWEPEEKHSALDDEQSKEMQALLEALLKRFLT
jgi:hypothetical protein